MKYLMLAGLVMFSLGAQAFSWFEGFYVGASGGVAHQQVGLDSETRFSFPTGVGANPVGTMVTEADEGLVAVRGWGEVYGGWGEQMGRWLYWGIRLGGNFSCYDFVDKSFFKPDEVQSSPPPLTTLSDFIFNDRVQTKLYTFEITGDVKPGFTLNATTMFFGLIGLAFNHEELSSQDFFQDLVNGVTATVRGNNSQHRAALRLGLGLEKQIRQNLAISASYVYTRYQKITTEGVITTPGSTIPNDLNVFSRANPRKAVASIGLGYYF